MRSVLCLPLVLLTTASISLAASPDVPETHLLQSRAVSAGEREILIDGRRVGSIVLAESRRTLETGSARIVVEESGEPVAPDRPYPRRVVTVGRIEPGGSAIRQEYTLLAPAAPLHVEGLGLQLPTDEPGFNEDEHAELRAWLEEQGLAADTAGFEELHCAEAGRDLTVWYEISGKRVDGSLTRGSSTQPQARFDSLLHAVERGWKIHHQRIGEKGSLWYHRKSLELVDTLRDGTEGEDDPELRSYHCGCYGYGIASDWATLGKSRLYHVEVEWVDHWVAMGLFVGWEWRDAFPWIGIGERERAKRLARRVKVYRLTDARGDLFAEVAIQFSPDPPLGKLGPATYAVRVSGLDGEMEPLAQIEHAPEGIVVQLDSPRGAAATAGEDRARWLTSLERLDQLLAAMPTQVLRGDGVRDSHLGEIETTLDWIRLILEPSEDHLADVVSEIDGLTAISKVEALLGSGGARFLADPSELPLPPGRHSESSGRSACNPRPE